MLCIDTRSLRNRGKLISRSSVVNNSFLYNVEILCFVHSYGLLGPSGCGKSTLLQCILGVLPLDSGTIETEIHGRSDVGYMPQVNRKKKKKNETNCFIDTYLFILKDLCLDGKLTIRETFEYYGIIYKMKKTNIKNKINELKTILSLPDLNSYVEDIR